MNTPAIRRPSVTIGVASVVLVVLALGAQALRQPEIATPSDAAALRFWRALYVEGVEAFRYDSLDDMIGASDAVVVGVIEGVKPGREVRDLAAEATGISREIASTYFVETDIRVMQVLHGNLSATAGGRVRLDLLTPLPEVVAVLQAAVPQPRAVFFLRDMGRYYDRVELDGLYQLMSHQGVLRDAGGIVGTPEGRTDPFLIELQGQPFEALLQRLGPPPLTN